MVPIDKLKLGGAVSIALFIAYFIYPYISGYSEVTVCNTAPYSIKQVVLAQDKDRVIPLGGWFSLAPGECSQKHKRFWREKRGFYVHTQIPETEKPILKYVNDIVNSQIIADDDPSNDANAISLDGSEVPRFGSLTVCFAKWKNIAPESIVLNEKCEEKNYTAHLLSAYHYGQQSTWYFIWENPNLPLTPSDKNIDTALDIAREGARLMRAAVDSQLRNAEMWRNISPFSFGGKLVDFNGPLNLGVGISEVVPKTLYGEPMALRDNDIIIEINGVKVLGERDLHQHLIQHAISRDHGIEAPVEYVVMRENQFYKIKNTYFFNPSYKTNSEDMNGVAFWYGVGDAITFGQTPWVVCNGSNFLRGVGNVISGGFELLGSTIQKREFDRDSLKAFEYIDATECRWQKAQQKALAQQKSEDIYISSQWFAIFTPSGVRAVGARAMRNRTARAVGRGALSRGLADASLEAAETALWSIGTSPPGSPLSTRLGEAAKFAPLGALGGFITGAALASQKAR